MKDGEASDKPIDGVVLCRLKQFRDMNKLKKVALKVKSYHSRFLQMIVLPIFVYEASVMMCASDLQVIAASLSEEEIKGLKTLFTNIDTDKSGTITLQELKTGLTRLGSKLSKTEVEQLMEAVSYHHVF